MYVVRGVKNFMYWIHMIYVGKEKSMNEKRKKNTLCNKSLTTNVGLPFAVCVVRVKGAISAVCLSLLSAD